MKPNSHDMEKTMCRIDSPFGNISLDEKNDPTDRFLQAVDENCIDDDFRELFIKYFQNNWQSAFSTPSEIEDVLKKANQENSISDKCLFLLVSYEAKLSFAFISYQISGKTPRSLFYDFLVEVKNSYFASSPLALYRGGMKTVTHNYFQFLCWLYGEDYCYSKAFFEDEALDKLSTLERTHFFWGFFESISLNFLKLGNHQRAKELIRISSSTDYVGPLTKDAQSIVNGLSFIKAWIKFESNSRTKSHCLQDIFYGYHSHWEDILNLTRDEVTGSSDITKQLKKWLDDFRFDCIKLSLINTDLTKASKDEIEVWVREVQGYLTHINVGFSWDELNSDEFKSFEKQKFNELCAEFSHVQMSKWIEWSIQDDFTKILGTNLNSLKQLNAYHSKWVTKEYFDLWKTLFLEEINRLNIEERLTILSCMPPYTEDYYTEGFQWWFELFTGLVDSDSFPKHLIPSWTCVALNLKVRDEALPYVDKSIGILRGELSAPDKTNDEIKEHHKHLSCLLPAIDRISTQKGLRHRLMLQRFSAVPYSDEKLLMYSGALYQGHFYDWYTPFNDLASRWFCHQHNHKVQNRHTIDEEFEHKFYTEFACELSDFFLTRLRLRKGEKVEGDRYDSSQVIEKSSVWRQGYLKALTELGFDLNGKVHKTVNFTKKSDPDESVRSIASECYKAVRRHAKKSPSTQDIKRGIVAAEWWLLMCQRHELGLEVKHEEALKTRRNLMRHP
ncbi:hypothetical protein [Shewanella glacialipiscicola]|uniref:hypothetical protein n=1 Tax=Shewanella glacialipiscicola TaxID=614069 RepID=UPI003D7AA804